MKNERLKNIIDYAQGQPSLQVDEDLRVDGISIDTRTLEKGEVYMPIIGENLDGHIFIKDAFENGAVVSFCDKDHSKQLEGEDYPLILVDDCLEAYQKLAKNYRESLDITIIGVTGSNGKTTTKDIVHSVLSQKYKSKKTIGNLNNGIGLPRTLLTFDRDTQTGITEMGMDKAGEISYLSKLAQPKIACITNVGYSHLEELKTPANVAKAKLEILHGMPEDGLLLYNIDDEFLREEVKNLGSLPQEIKSFGTHEDADYHLDLVESNAGGTTFTLGGNEWHVNLLGSFQMYNAAVGVIIGEKMGLDQKQIQKGLRIEDQTSMRSELISGRGFDILNDTYKSNPQSLEEALETTKLLSGYRRKIVILGDMLELGEDEKELHRQAGRSIDPTEIDYVLLYGPLSEYMMQGASENFPIGRVFHYTSKPDLVDKAKYLITKNSLVLVKASRSLRMEEIVESLQQITAH